MAMTKLVVGAIDFGTTFSGYAFSFVHDYKTDPLKINANHWNAGDHMSLKAPTTVLFTPEKNFHSFGYEAEDKYTELTELSQNDIHKKWYYFRQFKMMLHEKKSLSRETMMHAENKKEMPAMIVFTSAIKFLRDHLYNEIAKKVTGFEEDDISWVLTVPAIWTDAAKKFMRETAVQAGIKSECLSLALEPEAASVFCKLLPVDRFRGNSSPKLQTFTPGTCYIVLDLGGGTVDVSAHCIERDGRLTEIDKAGGDAWGGTQVDKAYLRFLEELFGVEVFKAFRDGKTGDFLDMMRAFELKKRSVTTEKEGNISLRFPVSYSEAYNQKCKKPIAEHEIPEMFRSAVELKADKLLVDAKILKQFFSASVTNTIKYVKEILSRSKFRDINTLLLVGGFAESEIVQESIKKAFSDKKVIVPNESGLAVLKGAVLLGHNPRVIKSRISKYTYGIEVTDQFIEGRDPEKYKVFENGIYKCRYEFSPFVRAGEMVPVGTVVCKSYITNTFDVMEGVGIYASTEEYPKYVVDESCFKLGSVYLDEPRQPFMLEMHFGEAEICLKFEFMSGVGKSVELDFLCH